MIETVDMLIRGVGFMGIVVSVAGPILFLVVLRPALSLTGGDVLNQEIGRRIARTCLASSCLLATATAAAVSLLVVTVSGTWSSLWDPTLLKRLLLETASGSILLLRIAGAIGMALLFRCTARCPASLRHWGAATFAALLTLATFPLSGHAAALPAREVLAMSVDGLHLLGVAMWIGGLFHLRLLLGLLAQDPVTIATAVRRFSPFALASASLLITAGLISALQYIGSLTALLATPYGLTLTAKLLLLIPLLTFGAVNFLILRPALQHTKQHCHPSVRRLTTTVEGELGLGLVILLLVGALTALPYPVGDSPGTRDLATVFSWLTPRSPHFSSPTPKRVREQKAAQKASANPVRPAEAIAYSEFNHQWAGAFVLVMGLLCLLHAFHPRLSWARAWPLTLIGLSIFLFFRNDSGVWPLGPIGFWESLTISHVLQHRLYVLLVAALGIVEWLGQTGRIRRTGWSYIFPGLCTIGGLMLFLHVHGQGGLEQADSLTHMQHVVMGILGLFAGVSRWLELRVQGEDRLYGKLWGLSVTLLGLYLFVFFREQ
jgi:putative copper resistance protein D